MTVDYDPSILAAYAQRLYAKARAIEYRYTMIGVLVGGLLGMYLGTHVESERLFVWVGTATVCGMIGFAIGRARAFHLRLEAQKVMCQAMIEGNTRETALRLRELLLRLPPLPPPPPTRPLTRAGPSAQEQRTEA